MDVQHTTLDGVKTLHPRVFQDDRGYFMESYNQRVFDDLGLDVRFVQDNESQSSKGALRGIHFQLAHPQGKLVRVVHGSVFDVAVDLRSDSPNFGKWTGHILSADNKTMMWIPPGFGHAYYTLSDTAVFLYKCTELYYPDDQYTLLWNDPEVNVQWPLSSDTDLLLSAKDRDGQTLEQLRPLL